MRWIFIFLALIGTAQAQIPAPVIDLDFTRSWDSRLTDTRASIMTAWSCTSPQVLLTFQANVPAWPACDRKGHSLGVLSYPFTQFQNQWSNDLTNAVWVATGITPTFVTDGVDANGSTRLVATSAGGTILQTIQTMSAQFRWLSAQIKCLTCTGNIWITQDGAHWTRIDRRLNTTAFTESPVGGLLGSWSPSVIGFKIDTIGDSIEVTYVNLENDRNLAGFQPSPPQLIQGTNGYIRQQDIISMPITGIPGLDPNSMTVIVKAAKKRWYGVNPFGAGGGFFEVDDGIDASNSFDGYMQSTALLDRNNDMPGEVQVGTNIPIKNRCSHTPGNQLPTLIAPFPGESSVIGVGFDINTGSGVTCNNGDTSGNAPETRTSPGPTTFTLPLTRLTVGVNFWVGGNTGGGVQRLQVYPGRLQFAQQSAIMQNVQPAVPKRSPDLLVGTSGTGHLLFETATGGGAIQCTRCGN